VKDKRRGEQFESEEEEQARMINEQFEALFDYDP
jgi:hypothetical protein